MATKVRISCLSDGSLGVQNALKRKSPCELDHAQFDCGLDEQIPASSQFFVNRPTSKRRKCEEDVLQLEPNSPNSTHSNDSEFGDNLMSDDDDSSPPLYSQFSHSSLMEWYYQYADQEDDSCISGNNWRRFRDDFGLGHVSLRLFMFAFYLDCRSLHHLSKTEFIRGMYKLKCDSSHKLCSKLDELIQFAMHNWSTGELKHLFTFVFQYLRESRACRTIDSRLGAKALTCLIQNRFTEPFVDFLLKYDCKRLNLDQFRIFIDFSKTFENDQFMESYDPNDAFPTMYDDFVEYFCGRSVWQ